MRLAAQHRYFAALLSAVAAMLVGAVATVQPARACICGEETYVVPGAGAVVPPNITTFWMAGSQYGLYPVSLFGPNGSVPVVRVVAPSNLVRYQILEPLQPNTAYRIALNAVGTAFSTFTTSAAASAGPPAAPIIESFVAGSLDYGNTFSSCNRGDVQFAMQPRLQVDPSVAMYEVAAGRDGDEVTASVVSARQSFSIGTFSCQTLQALVAPGDTACVSIIAVDFTGQRSQPTLQCARVRDCGVVDSQQAQGVDYATCPEPSGCAAGGAAKGQVGLWLLVAVWAAHRRRMRLVQG
jgi:hypothetical protein